MTDARTLATPRPADATELDRALRQARSGRDRAVDDLVRWLREPSISGSVDHRPAVERSARTLGSQLRSVGARVYQRTGQAPPFLVGIVRGSSHRPVVLFYGHYDVVAPGTGWTSPPFAPVRREGQLFARGANDDKGQLFAVLAALGAWHRSGGLPCTAVVVAEGAEEIGSPHLREALQAVASHIHPDVLLACDTEASPNGVPSMTVSQRGHALVTVRVDVGGSPVHSGRLGGAVLDPTEILSRLQLRVARALPRLCVTTSPLAGPGGWSRVHSPDDRAMRRLAPGRATWPANLDARVTRQPVMTVVDVARNGTPSSVPSTAAGRWDLRVPPRCNIKATLDRLSELCHRSAPGGTQIAVLVEQANAGFEALPPSGVRAAIEAASYRAYGRQAALVRSGGSLPAATLLQEAFGVTPVLLGLGTAGGQAHGPDEHLDLAGWHRAVELLVRFLADPIGSQCGTSSHAWSPIRASRLSGMQWSPQDDVR